MEKVKVNSLPHIRSQNLTEDFGFNCKKQGGARLATAASHLLKVLFAASTPDHLVAITCLASEVSCWQACYDCAQQSLFFCIFRNA